jgi:chemotaxis-related protein WspB
MLALTFQVGDTCLALDVRRVHEVVPRVRLQAVASGPPWLAGVFVYRGDVVPVIDLHRLIGSGVCPAHLSARIILVPHLLAGEQRLIGLLAAQVADVRDLEAPARAGPRLAAGGQPELGPVIVDGRRLVHLVEVGGLLPESHQRQLGLVPRGLSA